MFSETRGFNCDLTILRRIYTYLLFIVLIICLFERICIRPHGKKNFAEIYKNLDRYRSKNNFVEKNNHVGNSSMMSNAIKLKLLYSINYIPQLF